MFNEPFRLFVTRQSRPPLSGFGKSISQSIVVFMGLLGSRDAFAGNWGEPWGAFLWGRAVASAQAIPVDSQWMLFAISLVVMLIGALKIRKK